MASTEPGDRRAAAAAIGRGGESLVLCVHGGAAGCGVAERHAAHLRDRTGFEAVLTCCLHGGPDLASAFSRIRSASVVIVPVLMADGYTSRTVLPRVVAAAAPDGPAVRVTPPLGTLPGVADIIARRALQACRNRGWRPAQTGLLVAGHGTSRDRRSGDAVEAAVTRLRAGGVFGGVRGGFLEQAPRIGDVLSELRSAPCVVAGYFADAGAHAVRDLPALVEAGHPDAFYLGPVGADPDIVDVIVELLETELPRR